MVVEDEGVVALQIKDTLESLGYEVPAVAFSGEDAVAKAGATEPDLVLMDIKLPGELSGVQTAQRIRSALEVPVVYLTAHSDPETLRTAELSEPYGYVLKPFEEKALHAVIQMALFKSRRIREDRQKEMWISAIPSSLSEAVVICDSKGVIKFTNAAAESLLALKKEEVFERRLYEVVNLVDGLTRQKVKIPVSEPLMEGRSVMRSFTLVASDGREIPVEFSASPLRSAEGTLFGILYVFRQTTERERVQKLVIHELEELSKLQKRNLPQRDAVVYDVRFDYLFHPTAFGGGCTLGYFPLTDTHVAFYALDVIEQGVLSALFSMILRTFLSPEADRGGILINPRAKDPTRRVLAPAEVVRELTRRFYLGGDSNPYFTLAYGILDTVTGACRLVRAGYPPPLAVGKDGVRVIRPEGYAIGLFPEMDMPVEEFHLEDGQRLALFSDGLIDCTDPKGDRFSVKRLTDILVSAGNKPLRDAVDAVDAALASWRSADSFEDDISLLVIQREQRGSGQ